MLTLSAGETTKSKWSTRLTKFDCTCGNTGILKPWAKVFNGHVKTCGSCNILNKTHWETTKYGSLKIIKPLEHKRGSNQSVQWQCDCGKEANIPVSRVTSGKAKSCGRCNEINKKEWETKKFGKLKMKFPEDISKSSGKKVTWLCDCGKDMIISIIDVTRGHTKSCGKCDVLPTKFWVKSKFGRLKLNKPSELSLRSNKQMEWLCDCGNVLSAIVQNVTRGRTTCCGKCRNEVDTWYSKHKEQIRSLKPPIVPKSIPIGPFVLLEDVYKTNQPVLSICAACGQSYRPRWEHVRLGKALTCGCSTNRVSKGQLGLNDFVKSLEFETKLEHKIKNMAYDIYVPERNTLFEFQGLKWHSTPGSKQRDQTKYQTAKNLRYDFISVYEDEWNSRNQQIKQLIRNRLGKTKPKIKLRASAVKINKVSSKEANQFYEEFHYIGKCRSVVSYGVYCNEQLIACCSLSKPTRQSKYQWELIRMTSNPEYRVHGVWAKMLSKFIFEFGPETIVSFSDNRLFTGKVYDNLGFRHDGDIPQGYYWTKGGKRFNKSGLRKRGVERHSTQTETELRESQGFTKIWDLGKKRWVWER